MPARYKRGGKHSNQYIKAKELGLPQPNGKKHRQITPQRQRLRSTLWRRVALAARYFIEFGPPGAASRMAEAIGIQPSQIHRFTCPECEHDQEPTFSVGMAILLYLSQHRILNRITIDVSVDPLALRRMHYNKHTGELEFENAKHRYKSRQAQRVSRTSRSGK